MSTTSSQPGVAQQVQATPSNKTSAPNVLGKRRRACEACRNSKAKCIFEEETSTVCKNCAHHKRPCIVEQDRRYPTQSGSGELVKRPRRSQVTPAGLGDGKVDGIAGNEARLTFGPLFPFLFSGDNTNPLVSKRDQLVPQPDSIDRGLISLDIATKCFIYFNDKMAPRFPWIGFPFRPSFSICRSKSPFIFMAMIAVGAGYSNSDLQARLLDDFYRTMADLVVYRAQKRSDIAHAILIATLWTPPPEKLEEMRYSTNIHLATSIALDCNQIGPYDALHPGFGTTKAAGPCMIPPNGLGDIEAGVLENWRVMLASYGACAMLALTLKRPSIVRFNDKLSQCLNKLQESAMKTPVDQMVVKWVRLQRISESLGEAKDTLPKGNPTDLTTMKRLISLNFESRLMEWKESLDAEDLKSTTLMVEYHFIILQISLLAISDSRNQLELPLSAGQLDFPILDVVTMGKSVIAARAILDLILSVKAENIPSLPSLCFPRTIYATMTLVKAASTITELHSKEAGHSSVFSDEPTKSTKDYLYNHDIQNIGVADYCDRVIDLLNRAAGPRPGRSTKVMGLIMTLKRWFTKNVLSGDHRDGRDAPNPFDNEIWQKAVANTEHQAYESVPRPGSTAPRPPNVTENGNQMGSNFNAVNVISTPRSSDYRSNSTSSDMTRQVPDVAPYHPSIAPVHSMSQHSQSPSFSSISVPVAPMTASADDHVMGMEGIPPLNELEEHQYEFLDALLGSSGGIPFSLVNDAMSSFGWM